MSASTGPIWHIGLFERHVFRNGRVAVLCLECGEMFLETSEGTDQEIRMERGLKRHVVTTHREYGLKLLESILDEEEHGEEKRERDEDGKCAKDTNTTGSIASTDQSHFAEVTRQSSSAICPVPSERIEAKGQYLPSNSSDHPNECDELIKGFPITQTDADGTSNLTECGATLSTTTPSITAQLLAATQQLCTSLNDMSETAAPILTPNVHRVAKLSRADDAPSLLAEERTERFCIDLPELPERVFPIYVDELSVRWHWLHTARNELQAMGNYEMRLISNELGERLFYGCSVDKLCPFRAVWVRERSAVYQSREHNHRSLALPREQCDVSPGLITEADCSRPLLSPQRPAERVIDPITDHSPNIHAQLPIDALIGFAGSPIPTNISADSHSVDSGKKKKIPSRTSKRCTEEWKVLAQVEPDESNLASICSQWGLSRQSVLNSTFYGTTRYTYGCNRRKKPFCCRFRAMFFRGQSSIYYRSAHNHSVPLSEMETEWLREWNNQRKKSGVAKRPAILFAEVVPSPLSSSSPREFVSDRQQPNFKGKELRKGQSSSTTNNQKNVNYPIGQCSPIVALQRFITYLDNRPSTSQQNDWSAEQQQSKSGDKTQKSGAMKREPMEE